MHYPQVDLDVGALVIETIERRWRRCVQVVARFRVRLSTGTNAVHEIVEAEALGDRGDVGSEVFAAIGGINKRRHHRRQISRLIDRLELAQAKGLPHCESSAGRLENKSRLLRTDPLSIRSIADPCAP